MRISRSDFDELVAQAIDQLPEEFLQLLDNVAIVVEEEPSREDLAELDLDPEAEDLFGLYQGVPLSERDSFYEALPDRITIYRRPILRSCHSRPEVIRQIQETVLHELGHHFGLDEHDMPY